MRLTRDSSVWTLSILGSIVLYLMNLPAPTQWSYHQWLAFLAATIATISGKLSNSWLAGKHDSPAGTVNPANLQKEV